MIILTIEDNRDLQLFYRKLLTMWGHQPVECTSLAETKSYLEVNPPPDLVLLDLTLPDATPQTLVDVARERLFQGVPLVITSGREDLEQWRREIGAIHAFLKPIDLIQLKTFITKFAADSSKHLSTRPSSRIDEPARGSHYDLIDE